MSDLPDDGMDQPGMEGADPDLNLVSSPDRPMSEEESGEELLDEDVIANDYRAIPELDVYDDKDIDHSDYEAIDVGARDEAERLMRKRDRETASSFGSRIPAALLSEDEMSEPERVRRRIGGDDESEFESDGDALTPRTGEQGELVEDNEQQPFINLDDFQGPLEEHLVMEATRKEIRRRFRQFVSDYHDDQGHNVYTPIIANMCAENRQSLEISYLHLSQAVPILAIWVADEPDHMLRLFDEEAMSVVLALYPGYQNVCPSVHVRVINLPIEDSLRDLRGAHLNALIKVVGVVTRRTAVYPQIKQAVFNCDKCRYQMGPFEQKPNQPISVGRCHNCQSPGPFHLNAQETLYENYQKITLQESPGSVPAGRVPRQKDVVLHNDLIDSVSPGEEVEITGIYQHNFETSVNYKQGFPVFNTAIKANYVSKKSDALSAFKLNDDDVRQILRLSKETNIAQRVFNSVGPSIWGHEDIKIALALAMFGGEPKEMESNKHRIRGDINCLIMGDPGTAKSQFLKYVEKTAPRAVYTTGKGASAVGLTASVRADPVTREWTLEGGALVLADQGVCLIDEFDKMNDQDRTSIHEAMEQQSISISKAGIITTLKARCSVIAAANPTQGRYDSSTTFAENVDLSDAILSRFDALCVVRDIVDEDKDRRLGMFVVHSHCRSHPFYEKTQEESENPNEGMPSSTENESASAENPPLPQDLFKKYIMYARTHCHPKLHNIDDDKIAKLYADLRKESMSSGGIPIAIRHIESIIRMSESHAKIHLREYVIEDDVNMAIRVMLESFITSQKFSVMRSLRKHFKKYISYKKDTFELLLYTLKSMVNETLNYRRLKAKTSGGSTAQQEMAAKARDVEIDFEEFAARANELQISNLTAFYKSHLFTKEGFRLDRQRKKIIKSV